jgi:hypothetical protein
LFGGGGLGLVCAGDSVGVFYIAEYFATVLTLYSSFGGGGVALFLQWWRQHCFGGNETQFLSVYCLCFLVVFVVDDLVRCIELSARATAKVRHAGVDRDTLLFGGGGLGLVCAGDSVGVCCLPIFVM